MPFDFSLLLHAGIAGYLCAVCACSSDQSGASSHAGSDAAGELPGTQVATDGQTSTPSPGPDGGVAEDTSNSLAGLDGSLAGDSAASQSSTAGDGSTGAETQEPTIYAVGTRRIEVAVSPARTLPVQLWYPAVAGTPNMVRSTSEFEPQGATRDVLVAQLAKAPDGCTRKTMTAADAPPVVAGVASFPVLIFSHCMDCVRFSSFSVMEHLASLGYVVAAPDHIGGTIYDGTGKLDADFLRTRAADIRGVLDALLARDSSVLPSELRGRLDTSRVGAFGHSYGSVTTGLVVQTDPRVKAAVFIAAPPENPALGVVEIKQAKVPALFIEAMEDNSIGLIGNLYVESNFGNYPLPAWLVQVKDAGHWSFSDIAALNSSFTPGCGMATRQTDPFASFTYLDIDQARTIASTYIAAFFAKTLLGDVSAEVVLDQASPSSVVTVDKHN